MGMFELRYNLERNSFGFEIAGLCVPLNIVSVDTASSERVMLCFSHLGSHSVHAWLTCFLAAAWALVIAITA